MWALNVLLVLSLTSLAIADLSWETQVRQYIEGVNRQRLDDIKIVKEAFWDRTGDLAYAERRIGDEKRSAKQMSDYLRDVGSVQIADTTLRAQVKNLRNIGTFVLQGEEWRLFEEIIGHLKSVSTAPKICPFQQRPTNCNMRYAEDVENRFRISQNPDELKHYWLEYVQKTGPEGKIWVRDYAQLYRRSAELNKAPSASYQHYYTYDNQDFIGELEQVITTIRPLYVELYAYIRELLHQQHPDLVQNRGTIPYHLMEKVLMQSTLTNSILKEPYPNQPLPNMDDFFRNQQFDGLKTYHEAEQFFLSLGLNPLGEAFWSGFTRELTPEEGGPHCKSQVFDFAPDVALKYCPKPTFVNFMQGHSDMAVIYHTITRNKLPLGINDEPCRGYSKALGNAAILSVSTPSHIKLRAMPNYPTDRQSNINRLFRQAMQTLFRVRLYFVFEKLFVRILDGHIAPEEYNCVFWNLMDEYLGIEPPMDRSTNDFDLPYQFYDGIDPKRPHAATIVQEVLGYQLYKGLCKKGFQNTDPYSLHSCDLSNNRQITPYLKDLVKDGSLKSWRDLIEPITETRGLDAFALMEYYEPLHSWLKRHNNANNLYREWPKAKKCFDSRWNPNRPGGASNCVPRPGLG